MHPAPSVILFSTLSGAGFGLLFFLGVGVIAPTGWVAFAFFSIAYLLAVGGLISSTFHLGHPERAFKAFRQWRSSWLSREGIAAVSALIFMALYGMGLVFFGAKWTLFGWIGAALSFVTVVTTAMIYTQIKPVPRWHNPTTPAMFLSTCLAGGALLSGQTRMALILLTIAGLCQFAHWLIGDGALARSGTNLSSATGLTGGPVRAFEPPHTGTNYLLREFVYVVGRKHAQKLRVIGLGLMAVLPILCLLVFPHSHFIAALAVLSHLAGVLTCRWLFFAEAEHVVGLYYGQR